MQTDTKISVGRSEAEGEDTVDDEVDLFALVDQIYLKHQQYGPGKLPTRRERTRRLLKFMFTTYSPPLSIL